MKKRLLALAAAMMMLLCACASQTAKEVSLASVMDELTGKYGLDEGMLTLTADDLMELYGIAGEDVKQFEARLPMESILADEIVLIEATDAQAAARVQEKLEARYQSKLNETRDYLPDEYAKVEKCEVKVDGNYVSLIVLSQAEEARGDYEKALK